MGKHSLKRLSDVVRALSLQGRHAQHEKWSREQLETYQRQQLSTLVSYAVRRSPFYKKLYSPIDTDPEINLTDLPIINKATMMNVTVT